MLGMDNRPRNDDVKRPAAVPGDKTLPPLPAREIGGQKGPEPTRYGDWEYNGRCTDF
jgi:hypothetical protein